MLQSDKAEWREVNGELRPFIEGREVAWQAQEGGQAAFLSCPVFEVLFAGNRGGGKSICLLMDFAQHVGMGFGADWRGVIFRQTYPQLADIVNLSKKWFPRIFAGAQFNEAKMLWKFPTKEELLFRHIASPDDYYSYHGWSIPFIGFEELTTWPDDKCYKVMMSICRSPNPNMPRKYRATTNPYGSGHSWVKARWNMPVPPGKLSGPLIRGTENGSPLPDRVAIKSDLRENKVLLKADPDYMNRIRASARNESELAAWVDGSWDVVSGGMFDDVWKPESHVVPDMGYHNIPPEWRYRRSYDHGQSRPFSVGWWVESNGEPVEVKDFTNITGKRKIGVVKGDAIRVFEWYGWTGQPNEGVRLTSREIALGIIEREQEMKLYGRFKLGVADSAIFDDYEPGKSVAGDMKKCGIIWYPADKGSGSRAQGWQQFRSFLKQALPVKDGIREYPGLFVCSRCDQFRRTVPVLPRDTKKIDDVDTTSEDHIGDEVRYYLRMKDMGMVNGSWK